jgi:hypothetical protein
VLYASGKIKYMNSMMVLVIYSIGIWPCTAVRMCFNCVTSELLLLYSFFSVVIKFFFFFFDR